MDLDSPASGAGQAPQVRNDGDGEGERIRLKERECVYTLLKLGNTKDRDMLKNLGILYLIKGEYEKARQIAARLRPLRPALSKEIERVIAAMLAIYSSRHTAKLDSHFRGNDTKPAWTDLYNHYHRR